MITIIEGAKGSGKTKKILDMANGSLDKVKGDVVFLATTERYRAEIKPQIKFINTATEGVKTKDGLTGFIKGLLSGNYDIEYIFVDGFSKMMGVEIGSPEAAEFFLTVDKLAKNVNFVLTVSCAKKDIPDFIAKYIG